MAGAGAIVVDKKFYLVNKTNVAGQTSWSIGVTALDTARMQDARELCSFNNNTVAVDTELYRNEVLKLPGAQEAAEGRDVVLLGCCRK